MCAVVTGVQTCALPICLRDGKAERLEPVVLQHDVGHRVGQPDQQLDAVFERQAALRPFLVRSEERRVGKECVRTSRSGWSPNQSKKNENIYVPYTQQTKRPDYSYVKLSYEILFN